MEVAGLAIGLFGLFSTCLDAMEKIGAYRDSCADLRQVAAQFEAHKLRFQQWGQAVGIQRNRTVNTQRHQALDDPQTRKAVYNLIWSIHEIHMTISPSSPPPALRPSLRNTSNGSLFANKISRWKKFRWALNDKAKYTAQLRRLRELVQCLYDLVPPEKAEMQGLTIVLFGSCETIHLNFYCCANPF